ncbi:MAG: ankyrin repeat domain-containing protein [Proteobacteria bacterium]|nr:ankyrin repeat domain-containing protein [Pseudomonadota bacterium]
MKPSHPLTSKLELFLNASHNGNIEKMRSLLAVGEFNINDRNKYGQTALIAAVLPNSSSVVNPEFKPDYEKKSEAEIVSWLLERGADPHISENNGYTAIHHAVKGGHLDAVRALVSFDPSLLSSEVKNWQPLHLAVAFNRYEIAEFLIMSGAVTQVKVNVEGREFSLSDLISRTCSVGDRERMTSLINSQQSSFALRGDAVRPAAREGGDLNRGIA